MHLAVLSAFVLLCPNFLRVDGQLQINAITPPPASDGKANTLLSTVGTVEGQIATSLLGTGEAGLLWGFISTSAIDSVCDKIVAGDRSIDVTIQGSDNGGWGSQPKQDTLQLVATGGCKAGENEAGAEFVFTDSDDRRTAIVCSTDQDELTQYGCQVWWTGDDVKAVLDQSNSRRKLMAQSGSSALSLPGRKLLDDNPTPGQACGAGAVGALAVVGTGLALTGIVCGASLLFPPGLALCAGLATAEAAGGAVGVAIAATLEECVRNAAFQSVMNSCFPGDALVQLHTGQMRMMHELMLADKVAAMGGDGKLMYDSIYAWGHKDPTAIGKFIRLNVGDGKAAHTLMLTAGHMIPVSSGIGGKMIYKQAADVKLGDLVWVVDPHSDDGLVPFATRGIQTRNGVGLYNPITLTGTIVVNGVVASAHSDWFLDKLFASMGMTTSLHTAYQIVLAPARLLWAVLGQTSYVRVYEALDNITNGIDKVCTKHGGLLASLGVASAALPFLLLSPRVKASVYPSLKV